VQDVNFAGLCYGWAVCGRPQSGHESIDATAVIFSVKCLIC